MPPQASFYLIDTRDEVWEEIPQELAEGVFGGPEDAGGQSGEMEEFRVAVQRVLG